MRERAIPVLRMTDEARARAFYVDWLGFRVDWEWRHEPETGSRGVRVRLSVLRGNRAIGLYVRSGFRVVGSEEHREVLESGP